MLLLLAAGKDNGKEESAGWRGNVPRPPVGRDKAENAEGLAYLVPYWFGYGFL